MKNISQSLSILLVLAAVYYSFYALMPSQVSNSETPLTTFATSRALQHVEAMTQEPHFVGASNHKKVVSYLQQELESLGLKSSLQTGYTAGDWANLSQATNVMTRIEGTGEGKALLLLAHYDSNPHSALGASDDASGVATILECVRAFLEKGEQPKNDIIIVITDAEELGLNGAQLFVKEHPWAKDVGLVLNFEARGSGGPSYMLIETNDGNSNMIKEFNKAGVRFPVANSFMYSIYKLLPNDTDLTVFREEANINGFNFAFIGDHFDYHTQLDNYERLDRKTLEHQGSYLMPLLTYFANADLDQIPSTSDRIYFNMPFCKLVSYPFSWNKPLLYLGVFLFIGFLVFGFITRKLRAKKVAKGFIPIALLLIINGVMGYFCWPLLKSLYPGYQDILHGFSYNGYWYIAAFVLLSIAVCFTIYGFFHKVRSVDLAVAPLFLWLVICALLCYYLPGGSFFIIPFYFALMSWFVKLIFGKISPIILSLLAIPILFMLAPFIQMFPVGLGLKMMMASTIFVALIFGLLLPLFATYRKKRYFALAFLLFGIVGLVVAHTKADFTTERPKPSSLVYLFDGDTNEAYLGSYDQVISPWVAKYLDDNSLKASEILDNTFSSKYSTRLEWLTPTENLSKVSLPTVMLEQDSVIAGQRYLKIKIQPNRNVNRLELFSENTDVTNVKVNGIALSTEFLEARKANDKLITHYITDNEATILELQIPESATFSLEVYEAANDLLNGYGIEKRPETEIPMPFVLNDATITKKTYVF